jgi:hypothetical protein
VRRRDHATVVAQEMRTFLILKASSKRCVNISGRLRAKNCQEMALKSFKRLILSIDGASLKMVLAENNCREFFKSTSAANFARLFQNNYFLAA